jgi:hypothetical protein
MCTLTQVIPDADNLMIQSVGIGAFVRVTCNFPTTGRIHCSKRPVCLERFHDDPALSIDESLS